MKKRLEFTDKQKAVIFQRDKGICAFSGKILWILHGGASRLWDTDWVDHIKPAMRGGDNSIENGICASSFFNSKKKDNSHDNKYLFHRGRATEYFYTANGYFSSEISIYIKNIEYLEVSDWYFNRALQNLLISVEHLILPYDLKGNLVKRDEIYWCGAAFKKIIEWKKVSNNEKITDLKNRLNIDTILLGEDQKIMLDIFYSNSVDEIINIAKKLIPYYKNSIIFFDKLKVIKDFKDIKALKEEVTKEKLLSNRDKEIILQSLNNYNLIIN